MQLFSWFSISRVYVTADQGRTSDSFTPNNFFELVRDIAGDLVESVDRIDQFKHPKSGRISECYRLNFRSMDRSLTNEEVNLVQEKIRERVVDEFGVELR